MSKPQFSVLEAIPEDVRRRVAERVFDQHKTAKWGPAYHCADGVCVWGALIREMGIPLTVKFPQGSTIARKLGLGYGYYSDNKREINAVIGLNDRGELATPAAVRKLLLGEE